MAPVSNSWQRDRGRHYGARVSWAAGWCSAASSERAEQRGRCNARWCTGARWQVRPSKEMGANCMESRRATWPLQTSPLKYYGHRLPEGGKKLGNTCKQSGNVQIRGLCARRGGGQPHAKLVGVDAEQRRQSSGLPRCQGRHASHHMPSRLLSPEARCWAPLFSFPSVLQPKPRRSVGGLCCCNRLGAAPHSRRLLAYSHTLAAYGDDWTAKIASK